MKRFLTFLIPTFFLLASCEKDPALAFPGEWKIEEGGYVKFNANGSGYSINTENSGLLSVDYFENDCTSNDTSYFYWTGIQEENKKKGELELIFIPDANNPSCISSVRTQYDIRTNNKIRLGVKTFVFDQRVTLVRN